MRFFEILICFISSLSTHYFVLNSDAFFYQNTVSPEAYAQKVSAMELESQQCPAPTVVCDCRDAFLEHFAGKAFSTFSAFENVLKAFEEATGMQFIMKRTCLFNEGSLGRELLVYRYMHYACVRHVRPASKTGQRYVLYFGIYFEFNLLNESRLTQLY